MSALFVSYIIYVCMLIMQVHLARDGLYNLEEFIKLRDSKIQSKTIPYLELQSLCRKTLATRVNRIEMVEVSLG